MPRRGAPWVLLAVLGAAITASAIFGLPDVIGSLSIVLELIFCLYFLRHFAFVLSAMRSAPADLAASVVELPDPPSVSVLVACKNEESVIPGLVASLLRLSYPADRIQWIVVDDASTDGTGALLDTLLAKEPRATVIHRRPNAGGGKSGALNDALGRATGEIVIVFDADHEPHADVLRRLVRHFSDPEVMAAQGRCRIRNAGDSLVSSLVAIDYQAGYLVNEYGRQSLLRLPAYGGANCAVRRSALEAVGGWNLETVTEDTDLTMRLMLGGGRVRYDVTAVDEEEGVVDIPRYWRQRYRWARGHQQVWRDYRVAVWRSNRLSPLEKLETTMFLLSFHLPVFQLVGTVVYAFALAGRASIAQPFGLPALWGLLFVGPLVELGGGMLLAGVDRKKALVLIWFLPLFLVSMAVCTKAWFDSMLGHRYSWVKTARRAEVAL